MSSMAGVPGVQKPAFEKGDKETLARLISRRAAVQQALSPGSKRVAEADSPMDQSQGLGAGEFAPAPALPGVASGVAEPSTAFVSAPASS
eukprot:7106934-Pyramimonas_sp.AAC.1